MTQLFDTTTYEDLDEANEMFESSRHLRSIPAGDEMDEIDSRTTQWRLDQRTIDVGRKGIQAARQALQQAARESSTDDKTERKAA